jgi:hypothetical protein
LRISSGVDVVEDLEGNLDVGDLVTNLFNLLKVANDPLKFLKKEKI